MNLEILNTSIREFRMLEKNIYVSIPICILIALNILGCGSSSNGTPNNDNKTLNETPPTTEQKLQTALELIDTDVDFTLLIEANNGTTFTHRRGDSSENTIYRSASTSKIVTSAVILFLVEKDIISLTDRPQDYLDFWPEDGNHGIIELHHLLSFTSGLSEEPICIHLANADFENCVESILENNVSIPVPGETFYYTGTHLQVAGLMAVHASGLENWEQVFDFFKAETQLFPSATYDLPSATNPRLAGGMHWQASEYVVFLRALYRQQFLSPVLINAMTGDQTSEAQIVFSPVAEGPLALDWHYGYGLWIECPSKPFNCADRKRVSSAGAYGAYPFIDFEHQYFGILAREGSLSSGHEGYSVWEQVENELAEWAVENQ